MDDQHLDDRIVMVKSPWLDDSFQLFVVFYPHGCCAKSPYFCWCFIPPSPHGWQNDSVVSVTSPRSQPLWFVVSHPFLVLRSPVLHGQIMEKISILDCQLSQLTWALQLLSSSPWHHGTMSLVSRSSAKLTEAKRVALETEEVRKKKGVATLRGGGIGSI